MRKILFLLIYIMMCMPVCGQTIEVRGTVKDLQQKPVADVIVKVTSDKTTLAFVTTNKQGAYVLRYDSSRVKGEALLTFSHISYEQEVVKLEGDKRKRTEDAVLVPKIVSLRELKVQAKPLLLSGDTLSYNLASFLGKGDVTLEDGLKRLPGIKVADDGAISFMGKGISKFYIEGLDMLGGRYNLATKNIPAEYATQVQVLQHHNARKIDSDEESDAVALNIKLAKKAKFRPFGQHVAGVGVREDDFIGAVGLTGMMFTDKFQLLGSAKFSNHGNFGSYDMIDHFGNGSYSSLATDKLGAWDGGGNPLSNYKYETNGYATLNGIQKVDSTRQFKANADYTYENRHNSFEQQTIYYIPGGSLTQDGTEGGICISEQWRPWTRIHRPMLELKYEDNASKRYLSDVVRIQAQFEENECPILSDDGSATTLNEQRREATKMNISNSLNSTVRVGKHKQSFTSNISFVRAPKATLSFTSPQDSAERAVQAAQSTTLSTNHSTIFSPHLGKHWRVYLPVHLSAHYNFIDISPNPFAENENGQRVGGWRIAPAVYPNTEWRSANQKTYISMGVVLRWHYLNYLTRQTHISAQGDGERQRTTFNDFYAEPNVRLRYTFSGTSELNLSSGLSNSAGDILDLLTMPVQTNYRSSSAASGVIGKNRQWRSSLGYKYQIPFSYFSADASASWNQGKRNVLSAQTVTGTDVHTSSIFRDSHYKSASGQVSLSKNILPITTKLSCTVGGSWGSSESLSQDVFVTTYATSYNTELKAVIAPVTWTELTFKGNYAKQFTRYQGQHDSYDYLLAHAAVAVYPIDNLELRAGYDFVRSQITSDAYKRASLLSASAQLKLKRSVWRLSLNNLLNARHYSYTIFSATDRYTFDSHLIGRTALLTCKLNIAK